MDGAEEMQSVGLGRAPGRLSRRQCTPYRSLSLSLSLSRSQPRAWSITRTADAPSVSEALRPRSAKEAVHGEPFRHQAVLVAREELLESAVLVQPVDRADAEKVERDAWLVELVRENTLAVRAQARDGAEHADGQMGRAKNELAYLFEKYLLSARAHKAQRVPGGWWR